MKNGNDIYALFDMQYKLIDAGDFFEAGIFNHIIQNEIKSQQLEKKLCNESWQTISELFANNHRYLNEKHSSHNKYVSTLLGNHRSLASL